MNLVLLVVAASAIYPADCRDFQGAPDRRDNAVDNTEYFSAEQEAKVDKEMELRGKTQKKKLKIIMKKLKALDEKLTHSNSELKMEIQSIKSSQDTIKDVNLNLTLLTTGLKTLMQAIWRTQDQAFIGGQFLSFSTDKLSWNDALTRCRSLNGRLAVLDNPQAFNDYANDNYRGHDFWLGGSDNSSEGTWTWIDGKSLGDSFPWASGQPCCDHEDCLGWGYNNAFNDYQCTSTAGYVCEYGVQGRGDF